MISRSSGEHLNLNAITTLVLDDNANTRTLIVEVLRSLGVTKIHKAGEAASAWSILRSGDIDLVFADIEMAGENGLAFVRRVRAAADPRVAEVVIIMVSAHATEARVIEAGVAGANSFLVKPFSVSRLARALTEGIVNRRALTQAAAMAAHAEPAEPLNPRAVEI